MAPPLRGAAKLLVALSLTAAPAFAQVAVTNRNQLNSPTTVDWNTISISNPLSISLGFTTLTISTDGSPLNLVAGSSWNGGFTNGQGLYFAQGGSTMTFQFSSLVRGLGTQLWFNYPYGGNVQVTTWRGSTQTFTYALATGGGNAPNNDQASVLGVLDNGGFDRLELVTSGNQYTPEFAVNQLTVDGSSVTPEPASMALLGTGLLGVVGIAARRRRVSAQS